jgi:hypothetical protein
MALPNPYDPRDPRFTQYEQESRHHDRLAQAADQQRIDQQGQRAKEESEHCWRSLSQLSSDPPTLRDLVRSTYAVVIFGALVVMVLLGIQLAAAISHSRTLASESVRSTADTYLMLGLIAGGSRDSWTLEVAKDVEVIQNFDGSWKVRGTLTDGVLQELGGFSMTIEEVAQAGGADAGYVVRDVDLVGVRGWREPVTPLSRSPSSDLAAQELAARLAR